MQAPIRHIEESALNFSITWRKIADVLETSFSIFNKVMNNILDCTKTQANNALKKDLKSWKVEIFQMARNSDKILEIGERRH